MKEVTNLEEGQAHDELQRASKKLKDMEKRMIKVQGEMGVVKAENEKAWRVIKREVGADVNLDELLSAESKWKGRHEKIGILKTKLKKAKMFGDGTSTMSVISEESHFTGTRTHAMRNLDRMEESRARENDNLKEQVDELTQQLAETKEKLKGAQARKKVLENQLKDIKGQFQGKVQVLLDKTENDDKLIKMLKAELKKGGGAMSATVAGSGT